MNLLLDTHVFIWAIAESSRLDRLTRALLTAPQNEVFVSAVTPWEIAIKHAAGRIKFPLSLFHEMVQRLGFHVLPILPEHGIVAGGLPRHHNDPFDRMLVAQALTENLTLVSKDAAIARYQVPILGTLR